MTAAALLAVRRERQAKARSSREPYGRPDGLADVRAGG
jgi:hypothetical protein